MNVLITSGGTKIYLDSVRAITNMSRGTFGSRIADAAYERELDITFMCAKDSKMPMNPPPHALKVVEFVTFDDYAELLDQELSKQPDIIILAAAVSDYGVENYVDGKIRTQDNLVIRLKPLPKLINTVRAKCPNAVICGFKLLVNSKEHELEAAAIKSLVDNDCDLVVGNDLRDIKNNDHKLTIVVRDPVGKNHEVYYYYSSAFPDSPFYLARTVVDFCMKQYEYRRIKSLNEKDS